VGVANNGKFTAARRAAVVEALGKGHGLSTAAGIAGIDRRTLYNWLNRGDKNPEGTYGQFARDCAEAEAKAADVAIGAIAKAMPDDWRAAMEYLSRRRPDEWGKAERHEVTGKAGEPIKVEVVWPGQTPE